MRSPSESSLNSVFDDFALLGLKPFHVPLGIQLDEKNPHASKCIRCETCDGFPSLVHAKSDAEVICVDRALGYPNVRLLTNTRVERLKTSPSGREVTSVVAAPLSFAAIEPLEHWTHLHLRVAGRPGRGEPSQYKRAFRTCGMEIDVGDLNPKSGLFIPQKVPAVAYYADTESLRRIADFPAKCFWVILTIKTANTQEYSFA